MSEEATPPMDNAPPAPETKIESILPQIEAEGVEAPMDATNTTTQQGGTGKNIDAMLNVNMNIQIVLGYSRMPIADLLKLSRGSVIELDKKIGEPVDIVINQSLVARGDLIKVGDTRIGISLTEIVKNYILES